MRPSATRATARQLALRLGNALRLRSSAHLAGLFVAGARLRSAPAFADRPALETWKARWLEAGFRAPRLDAQSIRIYPPESVALAVAELADASQVRRQVDAAPEHWVLTVGGHDASRSWAWQIVAHESLGRLTILRIFER